MRLSRPLASLAVLALASAAACSDGKTPDCSDAQCGAFTVLPDAFAEAAEGDGGDDASDAEESDALAVEGGNDAAIDQAAGPSPADGATATPADASDDGHADSATTVHIADSGHSSD